MHTHRIDTFLLSENLRLEIVHESNPFFAGEPISMVIRLRHLGSGQEYLKLKRKIESLEESLNYSLEENNDDSTSNLSESKNKSRPSDEQSWSMKSLLSSLVTNNDQELSAEDKAKKELKEHLLKSIEYHKPIQLITGYIQMSGFFQFDSSIISDASFESLGKKKIRSEASTTSNAIQPSDFGEPIKEFDNSSILKYVNSDYNLVNNGLISKSENQILGSESANLIVNGLNVGNSVDFNSYPISIIPQSLLFSELYLEPDEVKSFHFKTQALPKDLPPSYNHSNTISINYSMKVGLNKLIGKDIKQELVKFPVNIASYVSPLSEQYTAKLDSETKILNEGSVKELKKSIVNRRVSTVSVSSTHSGYSKEGNDNLELMQELKQSFVNLVEANSTNTKDIEELVDIQIKKQFPEPASPDEDLRMETGNNDIKNYLNKHDSKVRKNIANLYNIDSFKGITEQGNDNNKEILIPQIKNLQYSYQINRNGQYIANLVLSKPFYTTTDDIEMILKFDQSLSQKFKVTAVTASLESFELISPAFNGAGSDNKRPKGNPIYETHVISFDECNTIPLKILLPKSPATQLTGQFKTDIFQLKWMLVFKFVLIPREDDYILEQFYEDKKGHLLHAKENVEGEEFICNIPITLLPSSYAYGGW
ncbi:hypothetical protein TPHA_0A01620 [Tetrapisispora phaffii CBS 4417]|uniref:Uncharacterized protein n=1 Tax=Tetrapisispora phaffii (strain ATCC 24235 / CBS 4417 / NBRC 1672 / NRRL Y-8282 / UCD 70-5) TaxID=1071381 RepID=G8BMW7_TETPH|nr:hypothetical protein TPHA_0A01620 [Tetrapisispora phaffii CBS 4417]CCE61245.1 hypothetical protein TPHA_0A01620 [Tetrapisispora phaffii CBS 4417]